MQRPENADKKHRTSLMLKSLLALSYSVFYLLAVPRVVMAVISSHIAFRVDLVKAAIKKWITDLGLAASALDRGRRGGILGLLSVLSKAFYRSAKRGFQAIIRRIISLLRRIDRLLTLVSSTALENFVTFWSKRQEIRTVLNELTRRISRRRVTPHLLCNAITLALKVPDLQKAREFSNILLRWHYFAISAHQQAAIQFFLAGYYDEAERVWSEADDIRERLIKADKLDRFNLRLLGPSWLAAIGHVAHIDIYLKHKRLTDRSSQKTILVVPRGFKIPNQVLLDCWLPHLQVAHTGTPLQLTFREVELLQDEFWSIRFAPGKSRMFSHAGAMIQQEWDRRGLPPLLKLDPQIDREGWSVLEELGVPKGRWFVCLHVREAGFHGAWHQKHPGTRNADVLTYMNAVRSIVERGGYVIRMGDRTMKKMLPMEGLVDYAHCEKKSELMDIFLCAKTRFFIGTNSGLGLVPPIFGVPCALTNWSPIALPQWYTKDRFIPKMIYSRSLGRKLMFDEMFATPAGWQQFSRYFESEGLEVIDNTPEEIDDLVNEMLDVTEGREVLTAEDRQRLADYNAMAMHYGSYLGARIGMNFLKKYADYLPQQALSPTAAADSAAGAIRVASSTR